MNSPITKSCPKCSALMVLRVAKRGPNSGNQFWGCSKYPICNGTRDAKAEDKIVAAQNTTQVINQNDKPINTPKVDEKKSELTLKQKEQLTKLRDRLLNLSSRNRSIKLSRLDAKWTFDLSSLNDFNTNLANDLIEFCLKKEGEISLLPKVKTEEEAEKIAKIFNRLNQLDRSINEIQREKGLYDLYLGFPFISGIPHGSDNVIQAPIFLIPVKLKKITPKKGQPNWNIVVSKDNPPIFNKTLFLALSKICDLKVNLSLFEEEIPNELYGEESLIKQVHSMLDEYGIITHICSQANDKIFDPVVVFTKDTADKIFHKGRLEIKQYAVVGHFPQADSSIQKDYDAMINMTQEELEHILSFIDEDITAIASTEELAIKDKEFGTSSTVNEKIQTIDNRPEKDNFFLLPSDSSQDRILLALNNPLNKGLVIWGPPGTGKSQTIVNIISDCLSKNKTVLLVSQKRAALDVVFDRIGSKHCDNLLGLVHDSKVDKKHLYKRLIGEITGESIKNLSNKKITDPSTEIENITKTLKEVTLAYMDKSFGISLGEMYRLAGSREMIDTNIDPNWINSNWEEIQKTASILNSMQSHGKVKSHTQFDMLRKALLEVEQNNISDAISIVSKIFNDAQFTESSLIYNKSITETNFKSINYETFKKMIQDYNNNKSIIKYCSPSWWKLKKGINRLTGDSKLYLNKLAFDLKNSLAKILDEQYVHGFYLKVQSGNSIDKEIAVFLNYILQDFYRIKGWDHDFHHLNQNHKTLLNQMDKETSLSWGDLFKKIVLQNWISQLEKKYSSIVQIKSGRIDELRKKLNELLNQKIDYNIQELNLRYRANLSESKNLDNLQREISKRTAPSIRKLNEKYINSQDYSKLIPVWLSSPESVSDMFPLIKGMFDVVIFDEASQCTVENGLPAIFRGKQIVIAGDEKQLPPSKFFESTYGSDDDHDDSEEFATVEPSLLTLAKKNLKYHSHMLEWHYRSKNQELITFSNLTFYDGRMKISPNVVPFMHGNRPAINWISVKGYWENRSNEIEADKVIERIRHYLQFENPPTIGVITFNLRQKELIQDKIDDLIINDPEFAALIDIDSSRKDKQGNELDVCLFVKNIENVQGDERDVIIFSIGYAPDSEGGRVYQNFGPIGNVGGENRLNVAITRAIGKIDIVSSIDPENDLSTSMSKNVGPKILKQYLCYAKAISEQNHEKVNRILKEINPNLKAQGTGNQLHFDSPFEEEVYVELARLGYEVHSQVGQSGFRIDLAIVHPNNPDRYILGIECDGAIFHSGISIRERDVFRQKFLEGKGWQIHRIWSSNWWENKNNEIIKIRKLVESLAGSNLEKKSKTE